jgi:hypothetical protein
MLFKEIIAVYYENYRKAIHKNCEQITELLFVKAGGTYEYLTLKNTS